MTPARREKEAGERIKTRTKGEMGKGKWKGGIRQTLALFATHALHGHINYNFARTGNCGGLYEFIWNARYCREHRPRCMPAVICRPYQLFGTGKQFVYYTDGNFLTCVIVHWHYYYSRYS